MSSLVPFDPVLFGPNLLCAPGARPGVVEFLTDHPEVADLLVALPPAVGAAFGESDDIALETYLDPDDGTRTLCAGILTKLGVTEALEAMDILDRDWWLARAAESHGLVITPDFRT